MDSRLSWPNSTMLKVRLVCYVSESLGTCEISDCNHYSLMMKSKPWSSFVLHFPFHSIIIICKKSWERKIQGDEIKHWLIRVDLSSWAAFLSLKDSWKEGIFLLETEDWEDFASLSTFSKASWLMSISLEGCRLTQSSLCVHGAGWCPRARRIFTWAQCCCKIAYQAFILQVPQLQPVPRVNRRAKVHPAPISTDASICCYSCGACWPLYHVDAAADWVQSSSGSSYHLGAVTKLQIVLSGPNSSSPARNEDVWVAGVQDAASALQ